MAKPTIRSAGRHDLVLEQLLDAAETLFARQGVAGTSLQELADAVGLTRTGIYHYINGKDDLLEQLVRGFTLETAESLRALAERTDESAADRLHTAVKSMAQRVAEHPKRFRLLLTSEDSFPETLAKQHRAARRETLLAMSSIIDQAKTEGSCRPVDTAHTAFALIGVANWVAFWYPRPGQDSDSPAQIAAELADIALGGVLSSRSVDAGAGAIPGALALLREDVARLDHLLADLPQPPT
ncbi:TetR/AcrR family transcriptional regulator [Gordonia sp. TBRC 11910]|uniref:TetR/AcrR family transcriptional regulator n=1 Tax=Gordonia asplenii TaxID=2725283 RepID=A0A848L317_9ACTN|nr:TetR/AcrR family transcriptional regulator [Gordonia asplenii]NMO02951.1 TetR/AcrR family transcriptional regulator [Gordonia asplenii]